MPVRHHARNRVFTWLELHRYVAVALRAEDLPDRYPISGKETAASPPGL
jgi:hypothetical protein